MEERPFIDTVERLASVVHDARREQKLTQAQLAAKAGVSRHFLIEVEAGHPRAEFAKVLDVLEALGLSPRAVPVVSQWAFDETGALNEDVIL